MITGAHSTRSGVSVAMMVLCAYLVSCTSGENAEMMTDVKNLSYVDSVDAWHAERLTRLTAEDGWLSLVGLFWLDDGVASVGRGDADIVYDRFAVDRVGTIDTGSDGTVFRPGDGVAVHGVPEDGRMVSDKDGPPTVVRVGSVEMFIIERGSDRGLRMRDREALLRETFEGIDRFDVDAGWCVEATYEASTNDEQVPVALITGTTVDSPVAGRAVFTRGGVTSRLVLSEGSSPDRFFVVFGDATNGTTTYGGGRFLEAVRDGDTVVLDFNRAYNPPCSFTPYATCPLPVPDNRLPFAVDAGERVWGQPH